MSEPLTRQTSQVPRAARILIEAIIWIVLILIPMFCMSSGLIPAHSIQPIIGMIGLAHSMAGFWRDGRNRISAPGVALFGSGLFIFFPAVYCGLYPLAPYANVDMSVAVTLAVFCQLVLYHVFWQPRSTQSSAQSLPIAFPRSYNVLWTALALMLCGVLFSRLFSSAEAESQGALLAESAAYAGVVLLAVWVLRSPSRVTIGYLILACAFLIYMEFVFSGFGRLRLGSLGIALAILAAPRWNGRTVKFLILASVWPALMFLARARVAFIAELRPGETQTETGLESVLLPMVRFAQLIDLDASGVLQHSYGLTFFAAAVVLVPRAIWPDKPIGFGAELSQLFRPDLAGVGHTELALFHGELIHAIGPLGLLVMIAMLGLLARWVDNAMLKENLLTISPFDRSVLVTVLVILAASMVDLVWGGSFNYGSRVAPRLLILGFFLIPWFVSVLNPRREQRRDIRVTSRLGQTPSEPRMTSRPRQIGPAQVSGGDKQRTAPLSPHGMQED